MLFASTFIGLLVALTVWGSLYALLSESTDPRWVALAHYFEAFSVGGWIVFATLSIGVALLAHRLLDARFGRRNRRDD
jgi:hypothetical protein